MPGSSTRTVIKAITTPNEKPCSQGAYSLVKEEQAINKEVNFVAILTAGSGKASLRR